MRTVLIQCFHSEVQRLGLTMMNGLRALSREFLTEKSKAAYMQVQLLQQRIS
jgi:hypothetical protein